MGPFGRRQFLAAAAALLAPSVAVAQQPATAYRVGFLTSAPRPVAESYLSVLTDRLGQLGYAQGAQLRWEARHAEGNLDRLPALAAQLAALEVDAILAAGNPAVDAARRATRTIPIVMLSADPVAAGFVPSLSHPGGNLTGLAVDAGLAIWGKRLQLLKECAPAIRRVGVLSRTGGRSGAWVRELHAAASRLGVDLFHAGARSAGDFAAAFAALDKAQIDALLASDTPLNVQYRHLIVEFAARKRLPAVYAYGEAAEDGGLMAYGVDIAVIYKHAATYIARILGGAKPADLPIEQPTTFELVVNLRTASALGMTVPAAVLLRADRVIE